jgi:hypothetical protein
MVELLLKFEDWVVLKEVESSFIFMALEAFSNLLRNESATVCVPPGSYPNFIVLFVTIDVLCVPIFLVLEF